MTPEDSCDFVQNSDKQRVSWKSDVPVELYVHKSVPVEYRDAVYKAAADWEVRMGRRLFEIRGIDYSDKSAERDGKSVIYWESDWSGSRSTEQARTTIYWKVDKINEADMKINAKNFTFFTAQIPDGAVHLESLVIHELGHVLGLKHNEKPGSVMNSVLGNFVERDKVSDFEVDALKCEYF